MYHYTTTDITKFYISEATDRLTVSTISVNIWQKSIFSWLLACVSNGMAAIL